MTGFLIKRGDLDTGRHARRENVLQTHREKMGM